VSAQPPVVPGYVLEEPLGRGGSGEVWRAVPRSGGAPVAIKVLADGDPEHQAREAALLAELDHPHLVQLHEVVHQPRRGASARVALVLDLLEGGSLAALLARRGRLRPGEVVTAIAPVAAALAAAHEHGVIHGDLSPGNIVFTSEGRPVLTDLGMARVLGEEGIGGVTPAYVDPTVARGGAPGPASDVFGVAAAAFHALTGLPPWNGATPADRLAVAAEGQLPDLAELAPAAPAELRAVIARGLALDPHERGSAAAFALDLRHACRPEPVRLPVAGSADADLGRTGRGPSTELTHLAAGRRASSPPAAPRPGAPRGGRLRSLLSARPRLVGLLTAVVLVAGLAVWLATASSEGPPAGRRSTASHPADRTSPQSTAGTSATAARIPAPGSATPRQSPSSAGAAAADTGPADRQDAPSSPEGWTALVEQLYRRRAEALSARSADPLTGVYTPGSPQLSADRSALDALRSAGGQLRGFAPGTLRVTDVGRLDPVAGRVELRLVDSWSAYEIVGPGTTVARRPARADAPVRMVLVRTAAGWRIDAVERLA
jgi:hypothetical protein